MNFFQIGKRILLMLMVNFLIMSMIYLVVGLVLGWGRFHGLSSLMAFCLIWGMGGAFISLAISRWMAKMLMGVRIVDPNTTNPHERALVEMVHRLARQANLPAMPEVGIYDSEEINAFATGPSKSRALVAVSMGLLQTMDEAEVEGVLGHEIAHIANGDMVTMTLVQGVINAFVMFLSYIAAFIVAQALSRRSDDDDRAPSFFLQHMLYYLFQFVFSILGMIVVCWFSRLREFRADAGGAKFAGRDRMLAALKALKLVHEKGVDEVGEAKPAFQAMKISTKNNGILMLFSTHPPLEERIKQLEAMK